MTSPVTPPLCVVTLFDVTVKCVSSPESTSPRGAGLCGAVCGAVRCVEDFLLCPCDCVLGGGLGSCLICVGVRDRLCAHCAMCVCEYAVKCVAGVGHLSERGGPPCSPQGWRPAQCLGCSRHLLGPCR